MLPYLSQNHNEKTWATLIYRQVVNWGGLAVRILASLPVAVRDYLVGLGCGLYRENWMGCGSRLKAGRYATSHQAPPMTPTMPPSGCATDVVLVQDSYYLQGASSRRPVVAMETPLQVGPDVWLGPIPEGLADRIRAATEAPGENWAPQRQYFFPYAFYRVNAPDPDQPSFDPDQRLQTAIAFSRLTHPTAVGFWHAARLWTRDDGQSGITPYHGYGINPGAHVIHENENWLIPADAAGIHALITAFNANRPPARVLAALWHLEAALRTYFIDLRWPLLTTALEALVRIPNEKLASGAWAGSTKVFIDRLLALGSLDATFVVAEADLRAMYSQRSQYTHGVRPSGLTPALLALYECQENLTRGVIARAILDADLASIFASDATVAAGLPLR